MQRTHDEFSNRFCWTLKYSSRRFKFRFAIQNMHQMNDLRRIDLNLLVILDALLSEQHVTRAAERLHLSQPAVSHALARLRDLLGDPLLVRAGASLVPTPQALELMAPLAEALAQVQSLLAPNTFDPATARRTFRLAMSDYGAAIVLPGLIRTLRREAPGIDLQISHASREGMLEGVLNGDIDVAAGVFPEMPNELRSTPLFEEHYVCLVDRNSLPADGACSTLPTYLSPTPRACWKCAAAAPRKSSAP